MTSESKRLYDVIIIGAGPAGLKCAETLGGSGLKVLLLEQKKKIGPRICAGGLTRLSFSFPLPLKNALSFKNQIIILNGQKIKISFKNPLYIIDRSDLGQFQLGLVRKHKNIEIKTNCCVKEINKNFIITSKNQKFFFKKLIGADGPLSLVRRYLGLQNKIYLGMQYLIPKTHHELIWFFNPRLLKTGYAWIFPHQNFTSAGVFFNPKLIPSQKAKEALNQLLDDYGLDYQKAKFESFPLNCCFKGIKFGQIFLVGEAAGLVSADTGEGMAYALASGFDVAQHLNNESYHFNRLKSLLKYKKRQEFFLWLFDQMSLPFLQSLMFKLFFQLMKYPKFQYWFGN